MATHVCRAAALLTVVLFSPACRDDQLGSAAPAATSVPIATPVPVALPAAAAPAVQKQPPPAPTRLQIRGTQFLRADGTPFDWRGISAFRLLEMIARGRTPEVEAFLDWCSARELTVVRVLTMAKHLFALSPDDGRAALPKLLELAGKRGMYVEIVGLADTAEIPMDIDQHIREIGVIAARYANAIVEIANEPVHGTQTARVHNPAQLQRLAGFVPDEVPVALGAPDSDQYPTADFATVHFPRDSGDGGWAHVTALATTAVPLLRKEGKPLVNDEPIGAGEQFDAGRRDNEPERFRAAALLSRMIGMGATFHYEGGLQAKLPEGRQRECFDAWQDAWTLLPREGAFTLFKPGEADSPVQSVKGNFAGAYVAVKGDRAWLLVTRTRGEITVAWASGWQPSKQADWKASLWRSAVRVR